MAMRTFFY